MEQNDNDVLIYVSAENELLSQIKDAYEDVTTKASIKRDQREKYTNLFVEKYAEKYGLPKERVRCIVDIVVARTPWIKEIEDLEEELEEEFVQ